MLAARQTDKGDCMMEPIVDEKLVSFKELEQKYLIMSVRQAWTLPGL